MTWITNWGLLGWLMVRLAIHGRAWGVRFEQAEHELISQIRVQVVTFLGCHYLATEGPLYLACVL